MSGEEPAPDPAWLGFDWSIERYEDLVGRVIPDYDAQAGLIVESVREVAPANGGAFSILELGAGTGRLTRCLLEAFPQARLTAMDVSPAMLAFCRQALAPFGERVRIVAADFAHADLGCGHGAVVSRLAVHHLDDAGQQALFGRVLTSLAPGGLFVNSDMVRGGNAEEEAALRREWREYMTARGDDPDEWERWLVGDDDHPATSMEQLAWLEAAGFTGGRVVWQKAGFAIFRATRPLEAARPSPGSTGR